MNRRIMIIILTAALWLFLFSEAQAVIEIRNFTQNPINLVFSRGQFKGNGTIPARCPRSHGGFTISQGRYANMLIKLSFEGKEFFCQMVDNNSIIIIDGGNGRFSCQVKIR